jgi:hypothetical protein
MLEFELSGMQSLTLNQDWVVADFNSRADMR